MRSLFFFLFIIASATASTQESRPKRSAGFPGVRPVREINVANTALKPPTRPAQPSPPTVTQQAPSVKTQEESFAPLLSKETFVSCLAFLAGIGDVVSYRRYGCYANMMTGNTIRLTTSLAELRFKDALLFGSLLLSYGTGVGVFRAVDLFCKSRCHNHAASSSRPSCFAVAPVIAVLFALVDFLVNVHGDFGFRGFIPLLALGFGMLNAATSDALGGLVTYAMTGHVSKLGQAAADRLFLKGKKKGPNTSACAIVFFGLGIAAGVVLSNWLGPSPNLGNVPPFTTLGVLYSLLLGLHSISVSDVKQLLSILGIRKVKSIASRGVNIVASATLMDITMDGWSAIPSGPAPFQDGQS